MNNSKEWFIDAPWGHIALASWGDPKGERVLLVHGNQDSMSTFVPLRPFLPARFCYVAMDLPGNGKSDAFPTGVALTRLLPVTAIDVVIRHLKWETFVHIGHSMGGELGLFYNVLNPGKVSRIILLDVKPGLQRLQMKDVALYYKSFYQEYYGNYAKYNVDDRKYTKAEAIQAVVRARGMTESQAEVILERNLTDIGDSKYKLSWDRRQKIPAPCHFPEEFYIELFSKDVPPSLYINARQSKGRYYPKGRAAADRIFEALKRNANVWMVDVEGGHDVHFMHPERLEREICAFLDRKSDSKSKL